MLKHLVVPIMAMFVAMTAYAACDEGYGLDETGTCVACNGGWYCPDDGSDERLECPYTDADFFIQKLRAFGINDELSEVRVVRASWYDPGDNRQHPSYEIEHCWYVAHLTMPRGTLYLQQNYNTSTKEYWTSNILRWYDPGPGYYLKKFLSGRFYAEVIACTNAPSEHAHYTGPGTPDVGNCPWECDCGYVKNGNSCVAAGECTAGVKTLRTGTGLIYKLYSAQTTSPTIAIGLNGNVCYACLAPGAADGALNLEWDAGTFHAVNGD